MFTSLSPSLSLYIYIYIYIHTHTSFKGRKFPPTTSYSLLTHVQLQGCRAKKEGRTPSVCARICSASRGLPGRGGKCPGGVGGRRPC